jgi:hypothetical protein
MEPFLIIVVAITSLGGFAVGTRLLGRSPAELRAALGATLQCVGTAAIFAALNIALAAGLILAVRSFTPWFASLYLLDDATWLAVALFQGIAWSLWRPTRR